MKTRATTNSGAVQDGVVKDRTVRVAAMSDAEWKCFRRACFDADKHVNEVVTDLIRGWLADQQKSVRLN